MRRFQRFTGTRILSVSLLWLLAAASEGQAELQPLLSVDSVSSAFEIDYLGPNVMDADGDGRADIVYLAKGDSISIFAKRLNGTSIGRYDLPPLSQLCPTCGPNWTYNCCGQILFGEFDPTSAGREALVEWDYYEPSGGGSARGVTLFTSSGAAVQTILEVELDFVSDFDGNGTDEVVIRSENPERFQVWGHVTTPVLVTDLTASMHEGTVRVSWTVAGEGGVDGFHVYRRSAGAEWTRLTDPPVGASERHFDDFNVAVGQTLEYVVAVVDAGGVETRSHSATIVVAGPQKVALEAFPNPLNPSSVVRFALPLAARVDIGVVDVAGRHVKTLLRGQLPAGVHRTLWDGRDDAGRPVASGTYFYRLDAGGAILTDKVTILK